MKCRRNNLLSYLAVLAVSVTATACAPATPPSAPTQPAQSAVSVKWIWTAVSGVSAGGWTAVDAGYFKEEGLNVEPIHIPSSSRAVPAVMANEAQFTNLDGNLLVQASLQGADVVGLMAVTNRLVFSVMAEPSIASGTDLKGKRLGITRTGSSTHTAALQALGMWKLDPDKDVALIQLSELPSILAGLEAKQIDAGVVSPPTNTRAKAAGFKELMNMATEGPEYASVTIGSTRAYAADHHTEVLAFARGYARGLHRFKTDKAYALQVLEHYFDIKDQAVLGDTWEQFSKYLENVPYITVPGMQRIIDEVSVAEPKAKGAKPEQFLNQKAVSQLDQQGYYKQLFGK
jgi:ABC-type nitrate/sulfonate/bicarbonate transport system substrate-binding protein